MRQRKKKRKKDKIIGTILRNREKEKKETRQHKQRARVLPMPFVPPVIIVTLSV
jgi:hypothetical protein